MRIKRSQRFGLRLNEFERNGLERLAEREGLSEAATLRRLLRRAIGELPARDNVPLSVEVGNGSNSN